MGDRSNLSLVGQKFGRWLVIGECILSPRGERKWLCECACGTKRYVLERSLKSGGSISCGCIRKEQAAKALAHDLRGKTFGELEVLHPAEKQRKNGGLWWTCRCTCGNLYDVPATLLVTGRRLHCNNKIHKNYYSKDISGQRFNKLIALYPLQERSVRGDILWHCRCDCGNEVDISYNGLVHCGIVSCGCQKKEHDALLSSYLTHFGGTSLDLLKSEKTAKNNTTGVRGVYLIRGKYVAKIVFQRKAYYLGTYSNIEEAAQARSKAEEILYKETIAYYERWKQRAELDSQWAEENPVQINVRRDAADGFCISFFPAV